MKQEMRWMRRRAFLAFLLATSLLARVTDAQGTEPAPVARAVRCVGLTVSNLDRSAAFYENVLDFRRQLDVEAAGDHYERLTGLSGARARTARMRLGTECLDLTEYLSPRGRPVPADSRSNDRWFQHVAIVVADMDRAYRRLRAAKVEHVSSGPQRLPDWNPKAGGIRAFYFRDPDRHVLEVIWFPTGKGDPRWRVASQRWPAEVFLGIDHTAIAVGDTGASLRFYQGVLGFRIVGESENWGTEQEHLNAVFGARLRITTLRAESGPGIELLEYLAPRDGRAIPQDEQPNDLFHWQTELEVNDIDEAARILRGAGALLVSSTPVAVPDCRLGFARALLARDPDGHAIELGRMPAGDVRSLRSRGGDDGRRRIARTGRKRGPAAATP